MHICVHLTQICPNKDLVPHPQKLSKRKNLLLFVFYRHFHFQNSISKLLTINGSKVMLETIIFSIYGSNHSLCPGNLGIPVRISKGDFTQTGKIYPQMFCVYNIITDMILLYLGFDCKWGENHWSQWYM